MYRLITAILLLQATFISCEPLLKKQAFIPSAYNVTWRINLETLDTDTNFTGTVKITGKLPFPLFPSNQILLYSYVKSHDKVTVCESTVTNCDGTDNLVLTAPDPSPGGPITISLKSHLVYTKRYVIQIDFTGEYSTDMRGLYKSTYKNANNDTRYLAATQFESTFARQAFPCFDEPSFKTPFTIKVELTHTNQIERDNYKAWSNSPGTFTTPTTGDTTVYTFEPTAIPLPTYLVAIVVADFESSPAATFVGDRSEVTVVTRVRPGYEDLTTYSQNVGKQSFEQMAEFTGHKYKNKKVDLVALPDFNAGAMENWGLMTFREASSLASDKLTTTKAIENVVTTVAHEIAHHWFGDLVTLKWWNSVWLNEGFATYFEYYVTSQMKDFESWDMFTQFVANEIHLKAYPEDTKKTSLPMNYEPANDGEVDAAFSQIAYGKGATILRMMSNIMGSEKFQQGIRDYVNANAEGSGTSGDLMKKLQAASSDPGFENKMKNWLDQPGYPVVTVATTSSKTIYDLTQERFAINGEFTPAKWNIPLRKLTDVMNGTASEIFWFEEDKDKLSCTIDKPGAWFILNPDNFGYFRVNYNQENWDALIKALNEDKFNFKTATRAGLVGDVMTLARRLDPTPSTATEATTESTTESTTEVKSTPIEETVRVARSILHRLYIEELKELAAASSTQSTPEEVPSYKTALDLSAYLRDESEYAPWAVALNEFDYLRDRLSGKLEDAVYSDFKGYMRWLLEYRHGDLGFAAKADDTHSSKLIRGLITNWACNVELTACVDQAQSLLTSAIEGEETTVEPDVTSAVYCSGLRSGDGTTYDQVFQLYREAEYAFQKTVFLTALGCTNVEEKVKELLAQASDKDDEDIRQQDRVYALRGVYNGNPENVPRMLTFMTEGTNLQKMIDSTGASDVGSVVTGIAAKISTPELNTQFEKVLTALEKINTDTNQLGLQTSIDRARETVENNLAWTDMHMENVALWLKDAHKSSSSNVIISFVLLVSSLFVAKLL